MAEKYLPLYLMDIEDEIRNEYGTDRNIVAKYNFPYTKDENEYIDILLRVFSGQYDNPEKVLIPLVDCYGEVMVNLRMTDSNDSKRMLCDLYDNCLRSTIYHIWSKNKQVYKPDKDFISALIKTENLKLTKETFNRLPCKHFFVDLIDCEIFKPVQGIFINIFKVGEKIMVISYAVNKEAFWSTYDVWDFNKGSEFVMNVDDLDLGQSKEFTYCKYDFLLNNKKPEKYENGLNAIESKFFIYQLLTYLSSHEPQFEESPITKSTYRPLKPGAPIKNKFSELQIHDIGIRFGKSFREQKKKYGCATILTRHLENKRKSPIPHFRAAHWQGYWVGRGRTTHVVRWIEPIFVNGDIADDVVIHAM